MQLSRYCAILAFPVPLLNVPDRRRVGEKDMELVAHVQIYEKVGEVGFYPNPKEDFVRKNVRSLKFANQKSKSLS